MKKPTYEELEKRVKEHEKAETDRKKAEEFNFTTENVSGKTLTEVVGKENIDMYNLYYGRAFA